MMFKKLVHLKGLYIQILMTHEATLYMQPYQFVFDS